MALLNTSYRYEIENCNIKQLRRALARQETRIKEDDKYATAENTVHSNRMTNEISKWSEGLCEASERRRIKRENIEMKEETRLHRKVTITSRRDRLATLLKQDIEQFEKELRLVGKTFHVERL